MEEQEKKRFYFISDVSQVVGKSSQTIKRWAKQKKIPQPSKLKSNGRLVFSEEQVAAIKKFATEVEPS